jgi:membrane-associated phospholipid phosphatase
MKLIFTPELWFFIALVCLGTACYQHRQKKPVCQYFLSLGINLSIAFILAFIVKLSLGRYRPVALLQDNLYGFHYFSLNADAGATPSGHTTMAFALFTSIARFYKKAWLSLLCMLPPIVLAFSRLVLSDHYLSDVAAAAYIGIISVYWGEWIVQRYLSHWKVS